MLIWHVTVHHKLKEGSMNENADVRKALVKKLEILGRTRLSKSFFLRHFL